ncbi:MAG: hypothetical protein MN733_21870 [Nitrososphaera sp.]|nr:hypothetical protein [Nitrososphaera sp.]
MDKKNWIALVGLALTLATNYAQYRSLVVPKEESGAATAHALKMFAEYHATHCGGE